VLDLYYLVCIIHKTFFVATTRCVTPTVPRKTILAFQCRVFRGASTKHSTPERVNFHLSRRQWIPGSRNRVCCSVFLTRRWGKLETRGLKSPWDLQLSAFTIFLSPPVRFTLWAGMIFCSQRSNFALFAPSSRQMLNSKKADEWMGGMVR